jgi:pimeloyl-ACP methyl ester carboxylesterase
MATTTTRAITRLPDQFVTVAGVKTHYLQAGSGHPLLILHGGAPGGAARVIYGPCIEPLAVAGLAVYAPDGPGFGLTEAPADNSVRFRIDHAKAFMTAMGVDRFHVLGNSMGVLPSLRLAIEDSRVDRVVLIAGAGVAVPLSAEAREASREHGEVLRSYRPGLESMRNLTMGTLHRKELVTDELIQLRYEMSLHQSEAGQNRANASTSDVQPLKPDELQAAYDRRTLILWGKNDHGNPIERGYRTFEVLPNSELHCFDNCGHWPMWDQTEAFVAVVGDFLNRVEG